MVGEKIIEILKKEYPRARRMVFMPYKAEMWDVMEGTYMAALDNYEVIIAPAGYREKYDDLLHVDRFYGPKKPFSPDLKPDIIIYHYPYDNNNRITEILPKYQTERLKKTGAALVYIPYFGVGCDEHFANQPGVKNADIVFAYDEANKELYESIFPGKKVYAVGNPKEDSLRINALRGAMFRPTVESLLGGGITLLATSLMPFLREPFHKMDQYRLVMERENKVIFRPHPLTIAGMEELHPIEFVDEWKKFLSNLPDNVILDTEPMVEVTMALCSKMVSDPGSLPALWQLTGKELEIL